VLFCHRGQVVMLNQAIKLTGISAARFPASFLASNLSHR
jgi:hypothetical protein